MSEDFRRLLDATIQHLEELKADGVPFVSIKPQTLDALSSPPKPGAKAPVAARPAKPLLASSTTAPAPSSTARSPGSLPAEISFSSPMLVGEARTRAMEEVRARAMVCVKCPHLAASRKNVVFGVGDIHSPLMFVGEAPGADEDEQGEPFVGKAGQLLTRIIRAMEFTRETVYIANILKCRPDTPGKAAGNRKPTPDEMRTCLPYLLAQIDLIKPKVIVALGATAIEGLFGKTAGITKLRGQLLSFQNVPVMPTFHPAYLLRNEALGEKRKVWEDMLKVLEMLGRPVSEKQRNYFLKA